MRDASAGDPDERTRAHVSGRSVGRPRAWVHPRTTDDVATTVRLARALRTPVVPVGRATTFWGGLDVDGAIALDVTRLEAPLHVDPDARTAHVGAGVSVRALDRRARAAGLCVPCRPDAGGDTPVASLLSVGCTSGLGMGFGSAIDRITGATVVTGEGEIVHLGASAMLGRAPTQRHGLPHALSLLSAAQGRGAIVTELGLALRRAPYVAVLDAVRGPAELPASASLVALAELARDALDRGAIDTVRFEHGTHTSDGRGRLEAMVRTYSDRSMDDADAEATTFGARLGQAGFVVAPVRRESTDARRAVGDADAFHWSFGEHDHRARLLDSAFWGVEATVEWGAPLGEAMALLGALHAALRDESPRHLRFAFYPGHEFVSIGTHLLLDPGTPRFDTIWKRLDVASTRLASLGVPYRRGALFAAGLEAYETSPTLVATTTLHEALFRTLDPDGILPGPRRSVPRGRAP